MYSTILHITTGEVYIPGEILRTEVYTPAMMGGVIDLRLRTMAANTGAIDIANLLECEVCTVVYKVVVY